MDGDVKRSYRSARRREQAEQTRERVLAAAERVFVERGFEAATVNAIAAEADVSPETVYSRFGTKRALLVELVSRAARGPDTSPILEQSGPRAVAAETDQRAQLKLFAADVVLRLERVGPLTAVLAGAAQAEPDLAGLLREIHTRRRSNLRTLVEALMANGPLLVDADTAADTVWALASPELHRLLTKTRGWSRARYSGWLAETLAATLLRG
jgi:AcrR family transcriptional regulator